MNKGYHSWFMQNLKPQVVFLIKLEFAEATFYNDHPIDFLFKDSLRLVFVQITILL